MLVDVAERALNEQDLDPDPLRQFQLWLDQAWASGEPMANAMAVASTGPDGAPAVRMVLLDAADERGFAFQTNLESPKARDFAARPRAALLFFWPTLLRQVRVTGSVSTIDPAEVRASFEQAPPEIQAMIRACRQGQPVADRAALEQLWQEALHAAPHGGAEMPPDWGGFRVSLETIEFWQGRDHRLQDRLRLTRSGPGWQVERLMP
jgi:pyridoxamine 5'-phosphate oxidase